MAAVAIATSAVILAVAYAIGGSGATENNWVGFRRFLRSLAVAARVRQERWALLWLPPSMLPALLAFLVLGEAFWWYLP
ncbi:MAG: hypothetical protein K0S65_3973 [Labilithrix sp.]|jgi:hypothetical protein|nr:hypothetical protein [Labilithrix sp.]